MTKTVTDIDLERLSKQYAATWNEPDPEVRRRLIRELWAEDGAQVLVDAPATIREAASALAFPTPALTVRGTEALFQRVTRAYEMFVAPGEFVFEPRGAASRLSLDLYGFAWVMVRADDGTVSGGGYEVVVLDRDSRIRLDHQYIGVVR